jgi:uncharacterized protein
MNTRTKGILWYLLIAFGLAWANWEAAYRLAGTNHPIYGMILAAPAVFAPALATFVVRKWIAREGFGDAGLRIDLSKWRYYLVAWLLPLFIVGCIAVLSPICGGAKPDYSFHTGIQYLLKLGMPASLLRYPKLLIVYWIVSAVPKSFVLFGEEFGWRGYLQLRLFPGRPLAAAVGTGIIWAIWHYPLTLRGFNYPDHPYIGSFLVFPVGATLLSIVYGWLRLRSGSIWASSLAHSANNVIGGGIWILLFGDKVNHLISSPAGILGWVSLGALSAWIVFTGQLKPADSVPTANELPLAAQAAGLS